MAKQRTNNLNGGIIPSHEALQTTSISNVTSRREQDSGRRSRNNDGSFHPRLITMQILSMQCLHYFLLAILLQLNYLFFNRRVTIDRIFTDRYLRLWHSSGWPDVVAILLTSIAGYVLARTVRPVLSSSFPRDYLCTV